MLDRNIYKLVKSNSLFRNLIWVNFWRYRSLTSSLRILPDFIIIGAQRCGTSSLFLNLIKHPFVLSPTGQELKFFTQNFDKGLKLYRSYFPLALQKKIHQNLYSSAISGEGDSSYLFYPICARRMLEMNPKIKLIVLLRNPIDRAYLHYLRMLKQGKEAKSFEEALEAEKVRLAPEQFKLKKGEYSAIHDRYAYLDKGIYIKHLKAWFDRFPREQIHIIQTELFFANPNNIFQDVLTFLELSSIEIDSDKMAGECNAYPIRKETVEFLVDYYQPYNQILYEFLGTNFQWDNYKEPEWYTYSAL